MIEPYRAKVITGARKALGQLKKVLQMVEDDEYCMDIIQQVRAVEGLLSSISAHALDSHLHTCGKRAFQSQDEREQEKIIKELLIAFKASKK